MFNQIKENLQHHGIEHYLNDLYTNMPGDRDYNDARNHIEEWYREVKPKNALERVIVIPNPLISSDAERLFDYNLKNLPIDKSNKPVVSYKGIQIMRRYEVEYNPIWLQFVVAVIITDEKNERFAFLKTTSNEENRIKEKLTFVQGHVTAPDNIYTMSMTDMLVDAAHRELIEEVVIHPLDLHDNPIHFEGTIHDTSNSVGIEHFGFVYKLNLKNELFDKLESNEPDKHEVVILNENEVAYNIGLIGDNWLNILLDRGAFINYNNPL